MKKELSKINKILEKGGAHNVNATLENNVASVYGEVESWKDVVEIGHKIGEIEGITGVINNISLKDKIKEKKKPLKAKKTKRELPNSSDIVIIGGGITGCSIARELSKYNLNIVLIEKESDVACGTTKANNGQIHTGIGEKSGTLKKELCVESWPLYEELSKELGVPYNKNGLLVLLTKDTLPIKLPSPFTSLILRYIIQPLVIKKGVEVGDQPRVIEKEELQKIEPNVTDRAVSAVLMPGYGVTCPYKLTIALAENAIENGVTILLDTEVIDIVVENNRVKGVKTDRGEIKTNIVVNAAGIYADEIAAMADTQEYTIHPRKGSILIFDKSMQGYINHQISELRIPQDPYTKGGGVMTTVDGNPLWGPTATEVHCKDDTSVSKQEIDDLIDKFSPILPSFPKSSMITYFSGLRAANYKEDFYIKASTIKNLIHAGGIQSPGLTAAPAIAKRVIELLKNSGLRLTERKDFSPRRIAPTNFSTMTWDEKTALVKKNPLYGNVVCRCEHVTEAEIVNAINRPLPATTLDAVKRRTRAGMGRCQGGFCSTRVASILARELNIPQIKVTKKGGTSYLLAENIKENTV